MFIKANNSIYRRTADEILWPQNLQQEKNNKNTKLREVQGKSKEILNRRSSLKKNSLF